MIRVQKAGLQNTNEDKYEGTSTLLSISKASWLHVTSSNGFQCYKHRSIFVSHFRCTHSSLEIKILSLILPSHAISHITISWNINDFYNFFKAEFPRWSKQILLAFVNRYTTWECHEIFRCNLNALELSSQSINSYILNSCISLLQLRKNKNKNIKIANKIVTSCW